MRYVVFISAILPAAASAVNLQTLQQAFAKEPPARLLEQLQEYLNAHPGDYDALLLQARLYAKSGDMARAVQINQKLIKQSPQRPDAYNNLAAIYAQQGKLEPARNMLEQALFAHPGYAVVYKNLSDVYVEMARDSYGKALQIKQKAKTIQLVQLGSSFTAATPQPKSVAAKTPLSKPSPRPPVKNSSGKTGPVETEAIITTLNAWAAAWSEKAVDMYLVFYDDRYHPAGMSRRSWERQRQQRLVKPKWIKVQLSDFQIRPINSKSVRVELIQDYRSESYHDRTRKEIIMQQTLDGWRITSERSIAKL